jgi:hypothetical protein
MSSEEKIQMTLYILSGVLIFFSIDLLFLVHGWLPVVKHFTPAHKEPLSDLKQTGSL